MQFFCICVQGRKKFQNTWSTSTAGTNLNMKNFYYCCSNTTGSSTVRFRFWKPFSNPFSEMNVQVYREMSPPSKTTRWTRGQSVRHPTPVIPPCFFISKQTHRNFVYVRLSTHVSFSFLWHRVDLGPHLCFTNCVFCPILFVICILHLLFSYCCSINNWRCLMTWSACALLGKKATDLFGVLTHSQRTDRWPAHKWKPWKRSRRWYKPFRDAFWRCFRAGALTRTTCWKRPRTGSHKLQCWRSLKWPRSPSWPSCGLRLPA